MYHCCTIAVRSLYDRCTIVVRLLYDCCTIAVRLLYDCCYVAVLLLYHCCTIAAPHRGTTVQVTRWLKRSGLCMDGEGRHGSVCRSYKVNSIVRLDIQSATVVLALLVEAELRQDLLTTSRPPTPGSSLDGKMSMGAQLPCVDPCVTVQLGRTSECLTAPCV